MFNKHVQNEVLYHHFQPIYDIHQWEIIGYEALLRSKNNLNPEEVFQKAMQDKHLYSLDTYSMTKAIQTFKDSGYREKLFINVYPSTLVNPSFLELIKPFAEDVDLVLEINESEIVHNFNELLKKIKELKSLGILIAIDDIGKGTSEIMKILEFQPDFIKMDSYITQGMSSSEEKQLFTQLMIRYCSELKINLILEGIEETNDLFVARENGASYGQGYLLGRPELLKVR